jgi:peroxiredoxin
MAEKKVVQVGKKLKDFKLNDQNRQEFLLSGFRGKRVLLSFHPLAWTNSTPWPSA